MKRHAFTIVELLIVIGIMAVLIGLLLPALRGARESSNAVTCMSNLRQLHAAAMNYSAVHNGSYPPAIAGAGHSWDFKVASGEIAPGSLWIDSTNLFVQQCPASGLKSPTVTDPFTGYNYNTSFIGHGLGEAIPTPATVVQVRHPERTVLFGEGRYSGGTNKFMRAPIKQTPLLDGDSVSNPTRAAGTQDYRHRGRTNVVFCDGHAEAIQERHTAGLNVASGTGFLSADNSRYELQ